MEKKIDRSTLVNVVLIFKLLFLIIFLLICENCVNGEGYNDSKKFEYSRYYRETLYEHICNYSSTLRMEIDNGDSSIFGVSKKIYKSKKNSIFNVYIQPVVRPRWYNEQLINRGTNSNGGSISTSEELKIYLHIDEGIFFLLKPEKAKKLIKYKNLLNKDFLCKINFYKEYIEDSTYYTDKILYYLENKDKIVSKLYENFGFYSDDSTDNKIRALNKYKNDMWNIIVYERG